MKLATKKGFCGTLLWLIHGALPPAHTSRCRHPSVAAARGPRLDSKPAICLRQTSLNVPPIRSGMWCNKTTHAFKSSILQICSKLLLGHVSPFSCCWVADGGGASFIVYGAFTALLVTQQPFQDVTVTGRGGNVWSQSRNCSGVLQNNSGNCHHVEIQMTNMEALICTLIVWII